MGLYITLLNISSLLSSIFRGYDAKKITENIECEIMQVVLEETHSVFPIDKILTLVSDTVEDMEENVSRIQEWVTAFQKEKSKI